MRGVTAFLVWLFNIWTWFKASFRRRWFKTPPLEQSILDTSSDLEQLPFFKVALSSHYPENSMHVTCALQNGVHLDVAVQQDGKCVEEKMMSSERTYRQFLAKLLPLVLYVPEILP
jgi:hypothetical protein